MKITLQDRPIEISAGLWRLWLLSTAPSSGVEIQKQIDPAKPISWNALDKLKELTEISYEGNDTGIVAYAKKRKLNEISWTQHGQKAVDLSQSSLVNLGIELAGPLSLEIPKTLTMLRLSPAKKPDKLTIATDDAGARLSVYVWQPGGPIPYWAGISKLENLSIANASKVDLAPIAKYKSLRFLTIFGVEAGVEIANLAALAKLPALERVDLHAVYHTKMSALPALNARVEIDGIRAADAAALKGRAQMRGVRTDAWLEKNADNPFRAWDEDFGAAIARRAAKAYRTAIDAKTKPEATLRAFVDAFNAVEKDIDTTMREDIGDAFDKLATRLGVTDKQAEKWFDAWRDF